MKWAVLVVRTLLGLVFVWAFVGFYILKSEAPPPPEGSPVALFMGAMIPTGYMHAVKAVELVGGLLLLVGRYPLVGLMLVTPVAVNILLFEVFIAHAPGVGVGLVLMCGFLMWDYRTHIRPVFARRPTIG
ncbi:MAG: hypothetical protein K2P78_01155 [Gemmataceae bacterium]|nr:hypothetical protein [Gemmataceae bacterium]